MTAPATRRAAESVRKAAAATFEALPAILLAAALLMPALASFSAPRGGEPPVPAVTGLGLVIAAQGNQALIDILAESRESLRRDITLPTLP